MTQQRFIIALVHGTTAELNRTFVKIPGMTVIEVPEDTYNFLYNSLIEKAVREEKERSR